VLLTFLGVRGSTAAPGADFVEFGGHTSCVAVSASGDQRPTLVLDAGTGLRTLTARLDGEPFRGSILLSHLHWDHVQGIPFFAAGDRDDSRVDVYLPAHEHREGKELLSQSMQPPSFPITPDGLRGHWTFTSLEPGQRRIESCDVVFDEVRHKGGRTFGYRISDGRHSIAYLPDHVAQGVDSAVLEPLISGVDLLIHDAQFLEPERALADAYGHSTVQDCVALATKYQARSLALFHHSPQRTDQQLRSIADEVTAPVSTIVAREGAVVDVSAITFGTNRQGD
jgi:phosphoribosyl 1,2-cyclic phosphodiesterase